MDGTATTIAVMAKKRGTYAKLGQPLTQMQLFMRSRGITQPDIVKATGLAVGTVSRAVNGKMTAKTLFKLCQKLKAAPGDLTTNHRLILKVAAETGDRRDIEVLAKTASALIGQGLQTRK